MGAAPDAGCHAFSGRQMAEGVPNLLSLGKAAHTPWTARWIPFKGLLWKQSGFLFFQLMPKAWETHPH